MESGTLIRDHSVLDRVFSNKTQDSYTNKVVLEAINSKVVERTNAVQKINTYIEEESAINSFDMAEFFVNNAPKFRNYISRSQNWIGHITELNELEFTAKLIDKSDPSTYEIAQFDIDEVSKGDIDLLKIGALFYWSIGYANQNGQISKQSLIRFKRSVHIGFDDFDSIIDQANELSENIKWE